MALHDPGTIEEGDPSAIRAQADELRTVASNIHTVARMLRTVSTKGVWESCAGTMFDNEVGKTPDDLEAIAGRLSGTERIIRPYADRLEDDQATLERIRTRYDDNDRTAEDRRTRLATMTPEDPEYVTVDREYRAAANARETNKREFTRVAEEAAADERDVARRLGSVAPELTDRAAYNRWEASERLGGSSLVHNPATSILPMFRPLAALGVAEPIGKFGRRAFYGEGSYDDVSRSTVLAVASAVVGKGKGAKANDTGRANRRADELATVKPGTRSTNPNPRRRIIANAKVSAKDKVATSRIKARHKAEDLVAQKTGARLIDDAAADWAAIAGAGRVRKGVHVARYSVKGAHHTNSTIDSVRSGLDRVDRLTEPERETRERQEREEAAERRRAADQRRRDEAVYDFTTWPVRPFLPRDGMS